MNKTNPLFHAALVVVFVLSGFQPAHADQACPSDADGDSRVTVAELVQAVRNALDGCTPQPCNGDADCDGTVTVSELIQGVNAALEGCGIDTGVVVDTTWLRRRLDSGLIQVLDARVGAFNGGHIPGALPLSPYAVATEVDGVPAQIVAVEDGAATLSSIGLRPDSIAVVYGVSPEYDPARVVWALRYLGHAEVRYLDGGWAAWTDSGGESDPGDPTAAAPTSYEADGAIDDLRVTGDWVLEQLGEPPYDSAAIQIVDARSPGEYQDGFIPTAVHRQWTINLDDSGRLLPREQLESLYADLDKTRTTAVYCLAGWRASVAWLVLSELGFEDVRVYDGSWLEWGDSARGFPIEVRLFDPAGVVADCRLTNKGGPGSKGGDLIRARLIVTNDSGVPISNIVPGELALTGAATENQSDPSERMSLSDTSGALFDWSFDLDGTVTVAASVRFDFPDGSSVEIGPVGCGTITGG